VIDWLIVMLVSDDESGDVDVENEDDNYEFYL
jgi:hypothetical protein